MNDPKPRLIALDFYDGPTEGFVREIEPGSTHFFRTVAWDERQDRRLYLLGRNQGRVFDELLELLAESDQIASGVVFIPAWNFDSAEREACANKVVEEGRRSLHSQAFLALGTNLLDDFEVVTPTQAQLKWAIDPAQLQSPGSLGDWIALGS
jgi:hypothetical protein